MATLNLSGLKRIEAKVKHAANMNPRLLAKTLMDITREDNRRGVLAGTDKNGNQMPRVKYRPVGKPEKLTAKQRNNQRASISSGGYNPGPDANLTAAEYQRLDGPPLAPRRQFSRVITNMLTDFDDSNPQHLRVWGYWDEVVSRRSKKKGRGSKPFFKFHFNGEGHNPVRDLRGIRPDGRKRCQAAMREWAKDQLKTYG